MNNLAKKYIDKINNLMTTLERLKCCENCKFSIISDQEDFLKITCKHNYLMISNCNKWEIK